LFRVVD